MKVCAVSGCPELITDKASRCEEHSRGHGWDSSTRRRPRGWAKARSGVLRRAGHLCGCGLPASIADHILPLAWGGEPLDERNLQALCEDCHKRKTQDEAKVGRGRAEAAGSGFPRQVDIEQRSL